MSVQAYSSWPLLGEEPSSLSVESAFGFWTSPWHEDGSIGFVQNADHSETMYRWAGRLQESLGSNIWSWST